MGGLARKIPVTFVTFAVATAAIAGIPPLAGFFSKDEILWYAFASSPAARRCSVWSRRVTALHDLVLHVPAAVAHVLRRVADGARGRASRPRVAAVDDRRAGGAGGALGDRRLPVDPALSSSRCCRCREVAQALEHFETPLLVLSVVGRARGLVGLARAHRVRRQGSRAPRACARGSRALHRLLAGKYYVDEAYDALARAAAELDLRPRVPAPRRPLHHRRDAERARALGTARRRRLGRVQTGNLQLLRAARRSSASSPALALELRHG